jgi:hypothetical protein
VYRVHDVSPLKARRGHSRYGDGQGASLSVVYRVPMQCANGRYIRSTGPGQVLEIQEPAPKRDGGIELYAIPGA